MEKLKSIGGVKLKGEINISGSKNAGLAIMAGSILSPKPVELINLPEIHDVSSMTELMNDIGVNINRSNKPNITTIDCSNIKKLVAEYDFVKKMRASVLLLGSLLGRFGEAKVSLPGGCAIGTRGVDIHIAGLKALGADIVVENGYIIANAKQGLTGCEIKLPFASVGATENIMTASVLAKGKTVIKNSAKEPEIVALAEFLNSLGGKITGYGTDTINIEGISIDDMKNTSFTVPEDRIEAGTYAIATAITDGEVILNNTSLKTFEAVKDVFENIGIVIQEIENNRQKAVKVSKNSQGFRPYDIETAIFPGFPTDLQAQTMVPLLMANGKSIVREKIFENRFMHVAELCRMGADITVHGNEAIINGGKKLTGANVMATDLRASASLVLASLIADGETVIDRIYHLDRGYEKLAEKLNNCGANITRIK